MEKADLKPNIMDMLEEHLDIVLGTHIDPDSPPEAWEEAGLPVVLGTLSMIFRFCPRQLSEFAGLSYDDLRSKLWDAIKMASKCVKSTSAGRCAQRGAGDSTRHR